MKNNQSFVTALLPVFRVVVLCECPSPRSQRLAAYTTHSPFSSVPCARDHRDRPQRPCDIACCGIQRRSNIIRSAGHRECWIHDFDTSRYVSQRHQLPQINLESSNKYLRGTGARLVVDFLFQRALTSTVLAELVWLSKLRCLPQPCHLISCFQVFCGCYGSPLA